MIDKKFYPDSTFYPQVTGFPEEITMRINSYSDLWHLHQIKDVYDKNKKPLSVTIPCIIDGQADRRFHDNESANLKLVCNFINDMKFEKVTIFHPHNAEVVEAIIDNVVIVDNYEFIKKVLWKIIGERFNVGKAETSTDYQDNVLPKELVLMSTDAGGFKPLMKLADKLAWKGEVYSASKSRSWDGKESKLVQHVDKQDFGGKDVLIIDDLSIYGGTFLGLSDLLKQRNAGKLYLAVSHITVQNPNVLLNVAFSKIFTTNSKFDSYDTLNNLDLNKTFR